MKQKLLKTAVLMTALSVSAAATAGETRKNVYKESQPNAKAAPAAESVNPCAAAKRTNVYKESQPNANAAPNAESVNPCAAAKGKAIYKESQPKAMPKKN